MCLAVPGQLLSIEVIGDYVLVHAGFAIATIDAAEAQRTLRYLAEMEPEAAPANIESEATA